ncbi:response regulator transcription factor [uncultured Cetobacterium sp.]|uniref:response regulator transcription factor n=1 Tax=uncultured Cetobacterium sp. TaxID=527638 RepID=UPI00262CD185|nr:response regulator transcription factor [uncultured Cetobacterium sp.]
MILLVEDSIIIRKLIKEILIEKNIEIEEAENGEEALSLLKNNIYDLIILDIMMPKMDGLELINIIRDFSNIPIIFLSALSDEKTQISAYNLGADGYITKPFSPNILISIIERYLRKKEKIEKYKSLELHFKSKKVVIEDEEIHLPIKEREILFYLANSVNVVKTRDQILNSVWGYDYYGEDRAVDKHISKLREQLGDYGGLIKTIKSIGYKFEK